MNFTKQVLHNFWQQTKIFLIPLTLSTLLLIMCFYCVHLYFFFLAEASIQYEVNLQLEGIIFGALVLGFFTFLMFVANCFIVSFILCILIYKHLPVYYYILLSAVIGFLVFTVDFSSLSLSVTIGEIYGIPFGLISGLFYIGWFKYVNKI